MDQEELDSNSEEMIAIATGGYEKSNRGVGFAILSNMSERIMSDLIDKGYVTSEKDSIWTLVRVKIWLCS